jgi:hypothetical protein
VTRLLALQLRNQSLTLSTGNKILSSPQHQKWLWGPSCLLSGGYWGLFPLKESNHCEAVHPPVFKVEVKNVYSYISTPFYIFMVLRLIKRRMALLLAFLS